MYALGEMGQKKVEKKGKSLFFEGPAGPDQPHHPNPGLPILTQ